MKKIIFFLALINIAVSLHAQVPPYIPTNGLVGWWPFNGNANDESGNNNNGSSNGAVLTTDRFGTSNSAYYFDGINDYITVPNSTSLSIAGNISVCAWIKTRGFNGTSNYHTIVNKRISGYWAYNMSVSYYGGPSEYQNLISGRRNPPGAADYKFSPGDVSINSWECWMVTVNSDSIRFYKNGVLDGTYQLFTIPAVNQVCDVLMGRIGIDEGLPEYFWGEIDDVAIWNRALTAPEAQQVYNGCGSLITSNPSSQYCNSGGAVQFSVSASGSGNSFQWQQDTATGFHNLSNNSTYSGTSTNALTITGADTSLDGSYYRCIVTSATGCKDTSNSAALNVKNKQLVFSQVLLITAKDTVPGFKVWKVEAAAGASVRQYMYRSRSDADYTPAENLILINGTAVSVANAMGTGAGHGSGDAGGSSGFSYAATPTNFPIWLPEGTTLQASTNVAYISVIEFDIVSQ